ncbi:MAG TPA: class I SAM-dependent methyltransferase, partial [Planctomycetota bacterium]|nr:class I SAM-dependent methyltransferase [Planctomycetota bacterium]
AEYERWIVRGRFNELPEYYPRYRSRYQGLLERFAAHASPEPCEVLDLGGGQCALLCRVLWGDRAAAADVATGHLDYLRDNGVETARWNLARDETPFARRFDFVFFSEVIEHLPVPGHVALERLRRVLAPGGLLLCTTPNFYRLRNVVYVATGQRIYDHFKLPEEGPLGHVIEYDEPRLRWQLERAGLEVVRLELCYFEHQPVHPLSRLLSLLGKPLFLVPRFRDCLVVIARSAADRPGDAARG